MRFFSNQKKCVLGFIPTTEVPAKKLWFASCNLTEPNPWDPKIVPFINPTYNPMEHCKPNITQFSKLVDGQLFIYINETTEECRSRCLLPRDDYHYLANDWVLIKNGSKPTCDVVEIKCGYQETEREFANSTFYHFLHAQVYRSRYLIFIVVLTGN